MMKILLLLLFMPFLIEPSMAQDFYPFPVITEQMELTQSEVQQHNIKKVTLVIEKSGKSEVRTKWVTFNEDGTVSGYKDYADHRVYKYKYDNEGRLIQLTDVDLLNESPELEDTLVRSFKYTPNRIEENWINRVTYHEWIYDDSTYSTLLEKSTYYLGSLESIYHYSYDKDRLVKVTFERDGRPYSDETFHYNDQNLLLKETSSVPWFGSKDSTLYYYGDDNKLDSTYQGHYRGGDDDGLLADWRTKTLFNANGKWYKQYELSRKGELFRWTERFYDKNGLLIKEEHNDIEYDKKITKTYSYEFYND